VAAPTPLSPGDRAAARALHVGWTLGAAAGATLLVAHLVNHIALDNRIGELQASAEHNVWSWAASMTTFSAALAALLYARWSPRPRRALALGAILVYFAVDDWVEIHENFGDEVSDLLGLPGYVGPRLWVALYLPLVVAAVALLWLVAEEAGGRAGRAIVGGLALLAAGYGLEAIGIVTKRLEERGVELPHAVRAGLEEGTELAGWVVVAAGLAAAMLLAPKRAPSAPGRG
jgi:hypothetical protein